MAGGGRVTAEQRQAARAIRDLTARLEVANRRIAYLERDKKLALRRAEIARNEARRLHGILLDRIRRAA